MKWRIRLFEPFAEEEIEADSAKEAQDKFYGQLDPRLDTTDLMVDVEQIEEPDENDREEYCLT